MADPVTWGIIIAVVVSAGAGFGAGWGLKPDASVAAIEAQTESIQALIEGNQALVSEVQAVAKTEAEREKALTEALTGVPVNCLKSEGGDPMSLNCSWALCTRTGESDKQRCETSKLTDALIKSYELDKREALLDARDAQGCPEPPL